MSSPYWSVGTCAHEKYDLVFVSVNGSNVMFDPATARLMAQALLDAADHIDDDNGDAA